MYIIRLFYFTTVIISIIFGFIQFSNCSLPEFIKEGEPFNLQVTIKVYPTKTNEVDYIINLVESYSTFQISKIKYRIFGVSLTAKDRRLEIPRDGTFYHDSRYGGMVIVDDKLKTCNSIGERKLMDLILPKASKISTMRGIVGPSWIFFYVGHKIKLKQTNDEKQVRNIPVISYFYQDQDGTNYTLFFARNQKSTMNQIPLQVLVEESDRRIKYDFAAINTPLVGPQIGHSLQWTADNWRPQLDLVTIEPGLGCSKALREDPTSGESIDFSSTDFSFSFIATVKMPKLKSIVEFSVAHDNNLVSTRVDRNLLASGENNGGGAMSTSMISNGKLALRYIASRNGGGDNNFVASRRQCIMAEEVPINQQMTVGQVLFGVIKPMVYLGEARVRGIRTRVYEAPSETWPVWFKQSFTQYKEISEKYKEIYRPGMGSGADKLGASDETYYAIVYLANQNTSIKYDFNAFYGASWSWNETKIVQIELMQSRKGSTGMLRKNGDDRIVIRVSDFQWSISPKLFNNQRAEDLFSLGDFCPPPASERNHYARVGMSLIADTSTNKLKDFLETRWIGVSAHRNLAILAGLQKTLKIPTTIINDFESRIISQPSSITNVEVPFKIGLTFNLAKHQLDTTRLIFMGKAPRINKTGEEINEYQVFDLQDCLFIAANQRASGNNKIMIFRSDTYSCILGDWSSAFNMVLNDDGDYHVFKIVHELNNNAQVVNSTTNDNINSKIRDTISRLVHGLDRSKLLASEHSLQLWYGDSEARLFFNTKSFEIHELDEKIGGNQDSLQDTNKFPGFGLVEMDSHCNRLVLPQSISNPASNRRINGNDNNPPLPTQMTFGSCQAACLADSDCNSFSVCVKFGGEIECILSQVNFRDPLVVATMADLKKSKNNLPSNKPIALNITNMVLARQVHIKRNSNCELHNKIYLDLFKPKLGTYINLPGHLIYPVDGREACARICFNKTLATLKQSADSKHKISSDLLGDPGGNSSFIHRAIRDYRDSQVKICTTMRYLDAVHLVNEPEVIKNHLLATLVNSPQQTSQNATGYCLIEHPDAEKVNNSDILHHIVYVEENGLEFYKFFDRKTGIKLRPSPGNLEMVEALDPSWRWNPDKSGDELPKIPAKLYETMRKFVNRGDNSQVFAFTTYDESCCAEACLLQTRGPWPVCKSFTLIAQRSSRSGMMWMCFLNSITLQEAEQMERFDLIEQDEGSAFQYWHYEPKSGFVLNELNNEQDLWLAASGLAAHINSSRLFGIGLPSFGMFILISISIIGGLVLGVKLETIYLQRTAGCSFMEKDTSGLVESGQTIGFENLVDNNFEG